jgi:hypothetical protein
LETLLSKNNAESGAAQSGLMPRRCAILLIGGDKTGNDRWYEEFVPIADALYDQHLQALKREGK